MGMINFRFLYITFALSLMWRQYKEKNKPAGAVNSRSVAQEEKVGHAIDEEELAENAGDGESEAVKKRQDISDASLKQDDSWGGFMNSFVTHPFAPIAILVCVALQFF